MPQIIGDDPRGRPIVSRPVTPRLSTPGPDDAVRIVMPAPYDFQSLIPIASSGAQALPLIAPVKMPGVSSYPMKLENVGLKPLTQLASDAIYNKQATDYNTKIGAVQKAEQKAEQTRLAGLPKGVSAENPYGIVGIASGYVGKNLYKTNVYDCSSFTQDVAKQAGINIGRSTLAQMTFFKKNNAWIPNTIEGAQPGDMVYFNSPRSPSGRHVGIYIGNGYMIDNPGTGKPIAVRAVTSGPGTIIGVGRMGALR